MGERGGHGLPEESREIRGGAMNELRNGGLKGGMGYLKRAGADITRTPRLPAVILILSLLACIPFFGAVVMYGYLLRWAREAAWRIDSPLRARVLDNSDGVLYAFGWRAFALAFLYGLIPGVVSGVLLSVDMAAQMSSGALSESAFATPTIDISAVHLSMPQEAAVFIVGCLITPVIWVSIMRMALYRDAGAGLQMGKIFQMIGRDPLGLVPVWILHCAVNALLSLAAFWIQGTMVSMLSSGDPAALGFSLAALVASFALQAVSVLLSMLAIRAVGLWTAQFEVAQWGPKEAPLPLRGASR